LAAKELDIAALPTNVAAALYQKTSGGVKMLAVNTLGVLYILENGNSIKTMEDLKGKTIYSTGEGANPEYILRYVLSQNGIDPERDVTIKFLTENDELSTKMASGEISIAMVPEPAASVIRSKNADVRTALSMNDEWNKVAGEGSKLMMGCVAVRTEFLEQNEKAVKEFLTEYRASLASAVNPGTTAPLCEAYGIIPKAAIAEKAIPNCQLTYMAGEAMKKQIAGYFNVLYSYNPKAIGGNKPDAKFYYVG
jgi:NitT/TauT family transport system substrate-binding protein